MTAFSLLSLSLLSGFLPAYTLALLHRRLVTAFQTPLVVLQQ